ncbi:hypothetical protein AB0K18_30710 [Nonomuraea sp. NPDC049421]|uniref:hypothetical protein n=1 Tax=Nonomuraea sp. NPDC049421 TaxID=3155275 RepID=UPI0034472C07
MRSWSVTSTARPDSFVLLARLHRALYDYYTGNTLARDGRLVAVLDWDEAFVCAPEPELFHRLRP